MYVAVMSISFSGFPTTLTSVIGISEELAPLQELASSTQAAIQAVAQGAVTTSVLFTEVTPLS